MSDLDITEVRVTDKVGVVGLDGTDYPNAEQVTTLKTDYLLQGLEILDTLGWGEVDVCLVDGPNQPGVILRPPTDSLFAGEQAGIAIAARTEQGREKQVGDSDE